MEDGKVMIKILYEDNHILVVIKEVGILSQSDGSNRLDMLTLLKDYLKEKYQKKGNVYLGLVHRLDKDVSGVMVFAKTSKAARRLSEDIRKRNFHKNYLAVVKGNVNYEGIYQDYIIRDNYKSYITNDNKAKEAILEYIKIAEKNNTSLVKINLKTGRHHQIRVQFKYHHHPLLGDEKYGEKGKYTIALYAYKLEFYHPIKKEKMVFTNIPNFGYFKLYQNQLEKI